MGPIEAPPVWTWVFCACTCGIIGWGIIESIIWLFSNLTIGWV